MISYFQLTSTEVVAHAEWEQILLAVSQTFEIGVLEQRIGIK